jgi:sigma-B regulation protein RsbU (phosphoserine phosphatase)
MGIQVTDLHLLRDQLVMRRQKLEAAIARSQTANLVQLLNEVDQALERVDVGSYGICEHCKGTVETERLLADPMARVCLECLPPAEQRALERDLELAAHIQSGLLPKKDITAPGWKVSYHYEPAGVVSGDYCDLLPYNKYLYFMIGDVSGKGIAASMLMANLHAMFRALIPTGLPLEQLVERANRIFCESTLPTQYATLVCGRADDSGMVEICNGGHVPPFHVSTVGVNALRSNTVPVGLFCDQSFTATHIHMAPGDTLVVYTDGISEAEGHDGAQYGDSKLAALLSQCCSLDSAELVERCLKDLVTFRAGLPKHDDETLMVLQYLPARNLQ